MAELVERYSTSQVRIDILSGLLCYRELLKNAGIIEGIQWVDGSFVENVESFRPSKPYPGDVDIVTLAYRPNSIPAKNQDWAEFVQSNSDIFDTRIAKQKFRCDAYYVDLNTPPHYIVGLVSYWFGLFSHQRDSYLWKGLLKLDLGTDDQDAKAMIAEVNKNAQ